MDYQELLVERENGISKLILNRPTKRNSLSPKLLDELVAAASLADEDPGIKVIVITGAGEKAFSAGFDISEIKSPGGAKPGVEREIVENAYRRLRKIKKPIIAMINGVAMGAGCDLITNCDFRIAVEEAKFAMPPAKLGVLYSWEGMYRFINLVGVANTKDLFMTGRTISAVEAKEVGLVNRVVKRGDLWTETLAFAQELIEGAPLSIIASKAIIDLLIQEKQLSAEVLAKIQQQQEIVWNSEDVKEGTRAFKEKRKPVFQGK